MAAEHASLLANDVWLLTDLPKGRKAMKSKWIWKVKYLSTGEIERFKACLVIKGFLQIAGKALYGLKQVPRQWHKKLDAFVCTLGFKRCYKDQYIYVLRDADDAVSAYFAVYVDDITLAGKDVAILARLKTCTEGQFAITDTGELDFLLGIKIQRDRQARTLYMHQNLFIQDLLARFNMAGCHPAPTPQAQGVPTVEAPDTLDVPYQSLVGALQYLIADILTKGLAQTACEKLREIAGITSADDLKSVTNEIAGITSADDLKSVRFVDPDDTSAPATRTRPASYKPLMKRSKRTFKAPKRFETVAAVTGSCAASPNRAVDHGGAGNKRAQNRMGRYHGR
ncbi:hypothetical protein AaE_012765 [Aphanomyces astaci]|uniref:Reverse transcriptase Ty1/copia-type domain-containing protein n=1 Tax=Aphanomyces astaci TaxID=112090 RepID=A0A6A4Z9Q2_APHAT|nr:hypothetical protein AaE_012765 [Aphanomyces astaci]